MIAAILLGQEVGGQFVVSGAASCQSFLRGTNRRSTVSRRKISDRILGYLLFGQERVGMTHCVSLGPQSAQMAGGSVYRPATVGGDRWFGSVILAMTMSVVLPTLSSSHPFSYRRISHSVSCGCPHAGEA